MKIMKSTIHPIDKQLQNLERGNLLGSAKYFCREGQDEEGYTNNLSFSGKVALLKSIDLYNTERERESEEINAEEMAGAGARLFVELAKDIFKYSAPGALVGYTAAVAALNLTQSVVFTKTLLTSTALLGAAAGFLLVTTSMAISAIYTTKVVEGFISTKQKEEVQRGDNNKPQSFQP
jgi:hypothetical protein